MKRDGIFDLPDVAVRQDHSCALSPLAAKIRKSVLSARLGANASQVIASADAVAPAALA
ncbi:hypothetical protein X566_19405 [Afipia sp. P52-10]|jgi:hypothetical protein|nr:hypothetical protein X566_19405 [Afipia sp. P52-10]